MEFPGFEYVDTVYKTLNASAFTVSTLWVVKSFAVVFLGINLIKKYIEGGTERDGTTWGLKPKDLLTSLSSILLVIFCTEILSFLDSILGSIEQGFKDSAPPLIPLPLAEIKFEDMSVWDVFTMAAEKTVDLFTNPFAGMEILAFIISLILWGLDIFIYPLFLAERFFLMGLMRVLFPIVITFSVLDKFKDLQWKFYKLYIGLYLVAPAFFLVNVFINKLHGVFKDQFFDDLLGEKFSKIIPDSYSSVIILMFILLLKFKLYRKSHDFVLRMFS